MGKTDILTGYLVLINLMTFALYGIDKGRAVTHRWRISEAKLLLAAWAGGAAGALAGMLFFRHKTRKWKFRLLVPAALAVWAVIVLMLSGHAALFFRTSADRLPDKYAEEIPPVRSSVDFDGDGVDDQTDILEGALAYIATKPVYKSKYYTSGYPDDGFGVCTDVVAQGMKAAGYDLMELVQEDIAAHPDDYEIDEPDANIDFRRVRNLKAFFRHTAISLTTDISEIGEWQGGDVVIFQNHVGIVSDRRNANGVPYVIHHNDPFQASYEQDILEKRNDVVGHYRISE